jgi:hypothetical protein
MRTKELFSKVLQTGIAILLGGMFYFMAAQAAPAAKLGTTYPGQVYTEVGNYSPTEATVLSSSYAEQGVVVARFARLSLTPYVAIGITADTQGFDWENRVTGQVGVKLVHAFNHGVFSVGTAYAVEDRFKSGTIRKSIIGYVNYWVGWHQITEGKRFPGSSWGTIGNLSPVERGNVLAALYVQQGVVAARRGRLALVPFGEGTFSRDTQGFDWNNRSVAGAGLKGVVSLPKAVVELGGSFLQETRFGAGQSAGGFNLFLKVWAGWGRK